MFAQQVRFEDEEGNILGGILVDDKYIICGCCGGIFEKDEAFNLKVFENWVDISFDIIDE